MTTASSRKDKPAKENAWHEQDCFWELMKDLDESNVELFSAIVDEEKKETVDQVKLKKLKDLRAEVLELLKVKDFEKFDEIKKADLRIHEELKELTETK